MCKRGRTPLSIDLYTLDDVLCYHVDSLGGAISDTTSAVFTLDPVYPSDWDFELLFANTRNTNASILVLVSSAF